MKPNYYKPLETERLILRKIERADAADVFEYASDEETTKYMAWNTHNTICDTNMYIENMIKLYEENKMLDYVFVMKETGKVIGAGGAAEFNLTDPPHCAGIGYILNKEYWGQGYAKEATQVIINYLFSEYKVRRIEASHFAENINSGKVMQKLGMKYEGESVEKFFIRGRYFTIKNYYLLNQKD